jgi:two-component system chemotaxis response regulator CheB
VTNVFTKSADPTPVDPDRTKAANALPFDVVAIGASAGGVEALDVLLPTLPKNFPAAILIVLHLSEGSRSDLASLYAEGCAMPVHEASDKLPIVPGSIYFAPPGYHFLAESDHSCALSTEPAVNYSRPSIDVLFESVAWTYPGRALGIVLTGASTDGAAGLAAIHAAGGITWAQQPDEAKVAIMPKAAIERGVVDRVLTVRQMSANLLSLLGETP